MHGPDDNTEDDVGLCSLQAKTIRGRQQSLARTISVTVPKTRRCPTSDPTTQNTSPPPPTWSRFSTSQPILKKPPLPSKTSPNPTNQSPTPKSISTPTNPPRRSSSRSSPDHSHPTGSTRRNHSNPTWTSQFSFLMTSNHRLLISYQAVAKTSLQTGSIASLTTRLLDHRTKDQLFPNMKILM